ncbi:MAG: hypothetical protein R3191_01435 [Anaerolineales bacterium]|nr:hypothetical protein [Anaerolineales bacterium]
MIARLRSWLGSFSPRGIALLLSVLLLALHGVLLATAIQRNLTASSLRTQIQDLRSNLDQLNEVEQETLADLQADLSAARDDVNQLETELPAETEAYPIYVRAYSLSQRNQIQLISVVRRPPQNEAMETGTVNSQIHEITAEGRSQACLKMIEDLEADGGSQLATIDIQIQPEAETCSFQVIAVWLSGDPSDSPNQGE